MHELVCKELSGPRFAIMVGWVWRRVGRQVMVLWPRRSKDAKIQQLLRSMGDMAGASSVKMLSIARRSW